MAAIVHTRSRSATLAAWLSLALVVPCFFLAFGVGEGLISLFGYEVGGSSAPPFWAGALATLPALLVFALPMWPTWHYGHLARKEGHRSGMVPFLLVTVLVAVFTLLNTTTLGASLGQ